MKFLIILNDPPYGTERSYNGLRLAGNLVTKHEQAEVDVFLMGDAVSCVKSGQTTPNGYYKSRAHAEARPASRARPAVR